MIIDTLLLHNNYIMYTFSDIIAYFEWMCLDMIMVLQIIEFVIMSMNVTFKTGELSNQIKIIST